MFERFSISNVRLVDLRRENFESYIVERSKSVKPSSINRELNLISHRLTQARRWRLMAHNPMEDLKRPNDPPHRERRISQQEIETVLAALNCDESFPVVQQQQKVAVAFLLAIETAMWGAVLSQKMSISSRELLFCQILKMVAPRPFFIPGGDSLVEAYRPMGR